MKSLLVMVAVLAGSLTVGAAKVDEKAKADMMAKMAAAATPGDPHKTLAAMAGDYTYTGKYWEAVRGEGDRADENDFGRTLALARDQERSGG